MDANDTYKSVSDVAEGLYKDQGSRFISFLYPVESEDEVRSIISSLRKEYHDARHHCYAFRLGLDGGVYRCSDDGEPCGTAGRPILGQIESAGLSDVMIAVVRYFGGVKLGVPGLIKAYKTAASDAIGNASVIDKVAGNWYRVEFPYEKMPQVMKLAKDLALPRRACDFGAACMMELRVRLNLEPEFLDRTEKLGILQAQIK